MSCEDIFFAGVPGPLRLQGCAALLPALEDFFRLWPHARRPGQLPAAGQLPFPPPSAAMPPQPPADTPPLLRVVARDGEFRLHSPWLPGPRREPGPACLLCSLAIELVTSCCHACPELLSLHAAAVRLHGRGLLFCGDNRAGKSTLVARLMADGARSFGDDMLGLYRGRLLSFGVAPRLRLPLPASPCLRRFAERHAAVADRHYGYLAACADMVAPWGEAGRAHAVILLERVPGSTASLRPATAAAGMEGILARFLIRDGDAPAILRLVKHWLEHLPCRILRYDDLDSATALLHDWAAALPPAGEPAETSAACTPVTAPVASPAPGPSAVQVAVHASATVPAPLAVPAADPAAVQTAASAAVPAVAPVAAPVPAPAIPGPDPCPVPPARSAAARTAARPLRACRPRRMVAGTDDALRLWRQAPGLDVESAGGCLFLSDSQGRRIFRLDGTAAVIWQLLAEPLSRREACALLAETFPDIPEVRIRRDLERLFADLAAARLIENPPCIL
ncbi:PqqD family peptide modification chaperone [uncultured Desulfovibrio sp.]|uniref:PqqD family peptide modification chaperone n=1 Tax=uncultured Desulfovibrio sp. TaxID=167968 RepID=UPI00261C2524|nr:PqqD family peptide modification chaperone [uncultured Desulfovibrio sp.]